MQRELQDHLPIESSPFLSRLDRLHQTGHDNRVPNILKEFGLQADIPSSYVSIGLKNPHPVLRLRDVVETFDKVPGKAQQHLLAGNGPKQLGDFWSKWAKIHPGHDVFTTHRGHLHECLPVMLHLDEGTSHKKKGIMVLSVQIVCGKGSRRSAGHNCLGTTYLSRMLFSVLLARTYAKKKGILYSLFGEWYQDLDDCYRNGIQMQSVPGINRLYPVVLACKGDWPALTKAGRLLRHHLRDSKKDSPPGICHLCRAGQKNYPWNAFDCNASWLRGGNPLPWRTPSPLAQLAQDKTDPATFFALDLFHVCHKGAVADYVASAVEPCKQ